MSRPLRLPRPLRALGLGALALPLLAPGAFRYAEDRAPALVDPLFTTSMAEARLHELSFEGLYTDDQNLAATPLLAESAQRAPDGRSLTVRLRGDVTWHDGAPLRPEDVVFTVRAMKDPGTLSPEAGRVTFIDAVEVVDPRTVRFTFTSPQDRPEEKLYFKILPAHLFDGTAVPRSHPFHQRPMGTGPYQVQRFQPDQSIQLQARGDGKRRPALPEIVMREVSDKNYQAKLLLYESLEALVRVLPRDLAVLQGSRQVELYPYQTNSWWYVGMNLARPPFDQPDLRRGLSLLIDAEALLQPVGTGDLVSGPYVPSSPYYNHEVPPLKKDEARAAEHLGRAGYTKKGGAWVDRSGNPLTFTLAAPRGLESAQEVVINLQSQLASSGVRLNVEFLDDAAWKSSIWRQRDFQLVLGQWSFDRSEDIREQFHSQGTRNFCGYKNPEVDRLLDEARSATDPLAKKQALRQVHALVHADAPMAFLWTMDSYAAMTRRVRDVVVHPFYFFTWVRGWRWQ